MVFGEGRGESYLDCQVQATLFLGVRVQEAVFASRSSYKIGCIHLIIYI